MRWTQWLGLAGWFARRRLPAPPPWKVTPPTEETPSDLINEINRVRREFGLQDLQLSGCLQRQAADHAVSMERSQLLTHAGFQDRLRSCGIFNGSENVAAGQRSAAECVADWMRSPGHRKNILGPWGIAGAASSGTYWCVIFGA